MRRDTAGNTRAVFLAPSARFDPSFIAISPRPQWMTAFKDRKDDHIGNKFTRVNRHRKHALRVNADRSRIMVCMRTLLLQVCQVSKLNGQQQTKRPAKPKSSSFETRVRSTCVLVFFLKKKSLFIHWSCDFSFSFAIQVYGPVRYTVAVPGTDFEVWNVKAVPLPQEIAL